MMSVKILGFGSNWWARFGRNPNDACRYTRHAAYYNSAGVRCGRKIKRHWIVPGLIRFNGIGDFDPHYPNRSVGQIYWCTEMVFACGGNRILFERRVPRTTAPDRYLVVASPERFGVFDFGNSSWKSEFTEAISISQLRGSQEAMLLIRESDWIRSRVGAWQLIVDSGLPNGAALVLVEDPLLRG